MVAFAALYGTQRPGLEVGRKRRRRRCRSNTFFPCPLFAVVCTKASTDAIFLGVGSWLVATCWSPSVASRIERCKMAGGEAGLRNVSLQSIFVC
jgi:hypothetical protein